MNKVYIIQNQHRWNKTTQRLEPVYDFSPAECYGELVFMLSPTASPFNSEPIIEEMKEVLTDFDESDKLLLVGNPALIGWATAIAADMTGGKVTCLQWSGKDKKYCEVVAENLFD